MLLLKKKKKGKERKPQISGITMNNKMKILLVKYFCDSTSSHLCWCRNLRITMMSGMSTPRHKGSGSVTESDVASSVSSSPLFLLISVPLTSPPYLLERKIIGYSFIFYYSCIAWRNARVKGAVAMEEQSRKDERKGAYL